MTLLGIDVGSSSVKAAILEGQRVRGEIVGRSFATQFDGVRAEVEPDAILSAIASAIRALGSSAKRVDAIAMCVMSPAWVAMDRAGKALTPIVTHQDRRSVDIARALEKRIGKSRHLKLAGNRPFPGSISSTTLAWYLQHEPARLRKVDLIGHLNTFLCRRLTGARVIDPSNASFTGLYDVARQRGWVNELCSAVGVSQNVLPDIREADEIAARVTQSAAQRFGLSEGTPVLTGLIDTSAAMLLAGPREGRMLNVAGSTDVLSVCRNRAYPHERLLTRALGVGRWWMSVATIAAAGSTFTWLRETLYSDMSNAVFWKHFRTQAKRADANGVVFDPYLAGERASMEQKRAGFGGLSLASTRDDLLVAAIGAICRASADRVKLLAPRDRPVDRRVIVSGGTQKALGDVLYRDWPGRWTFVQTADATLRGLGVLGEGL